MKKNVARYKHQEFLQHPPFQKRKYKLKIKIEAFDCPLKYNCYCNF